MIPEDRDNMNLGVVNSVVVIFSLIYIHIYTYINIYIYIYIHTSVCVNLKVLGLLHFGSCQNWMTTANLVAKTQLKFLNERVLCNGEPCTWVYVTLLQSSHRVALSIHWCILKLTSQLNIFRTAFPCSLYLFPISISRERFH